MSEPEILYIGIGLVVSLLYVEFFGVAPGGIIVPGYLALGVDDPATLYAPSFAAVEKNLKRSSSSDA